jgi:hypothetical protein
VYLELLKNEAARIAAERSLSPVAAMSSARRENPRLALLCDQELEAEEKEREQEDIDAA